MVSADVLIFFEMCLFNHQSDLRLMLQVFPWNTFILHAGMCVHVGHTGSELIVARVQL